MFVHKWNFCYCCLNVRWVNTYTVLVLKISLFFLIFSRKKIKKFLKNIKNFNLFNFVLIRVKEKEKKNCSYAITRRDKVKVRYLDRKNNKKVYSGSLKNIQYITGKWKNSKDKRQKKLFLLRGEWNQILWHSLWGKFFNQKKLNLKLAD